MKKLMIVLCVLTVATAHVLHGQSTNNPRDSVIGAFIAKTLGSTNDVAPLLAVMSDSAKEANYRAVLLANVTNQLAATSFSNATVRCTAAVPAGSTMIVITVPTKQLVP